MKTTFIMALSNILLALAFYVAGLRPALRIPALPAFTNQTDNGKGLYTVPDSQIVWGEDNQLLAGRSRRNALTYHNKSGDTFF